MTILFTENGPVTQCKSACRSFENYAFIFNEAVGQMRNHELT